MNRQRPRPAGAFEFRDAPAEDGGDTHGVYR